MVIVSRKERSLGRSGGTSYTGTSADHGRGLLASPWKNRLARDCSRSQDGTSSSVVLHVPDFPARSETLELLQHPARRRALVRRLRRTAHVSAVPQDGRRA